MRRILAFSITFILLFSVVVFAATTAVGAPSLTFSGTTANCEITVTQSGKPITVVLELYQGRVKVSGSTSVSSGGTYRLEASGTINGVSFTATPVTKTCP